MPLKVFVDSDVVISSLLSSSGAAFVLLNQTDDLELFISNISEKELEEVIKRLSIEKEKLQQLIQKHFIKIQVVDTTDEIRKMYMEYVLDKDDAHVVAGAKKSHVQFLISYNTKHFKADKLKEDFNIILTTPANLLQYLRSV